MTYQYKSVYHYLQVHNRVLRSLLPAHFSLLILQTRPSLHRNPDPAVIFDEVILIKIKTYIRCVKTYIRWVANTEQSQYVNTHCWCFLTSTVISFCLHLSYFLSLRKLDSTFPTGTFQNCVCPCCVLSFLYFIKT